NYAQDIAFDKDNDKLYGTLYAAGGLLCEIDTTSGAVTVYNTTPYELTGLAFPYAYTLNNNDIAVTNLDLPNSGCDVSATNSITITLKNVGVNDQSNIPVNIAINNGTPINETVAGPIVSGATLDYTFAQNFDFSADGVYNITAYSSLPGDENHNYDTIHGVVKNYVPTTVPTTINFDDINLLDRYTIVDNNGDDTTFFYLKNSTYAHSGSYVLAYSWSVNNPADDYFFSSCIDLTAGQNYKLSLWYRVAGASYPESFEVYLASVPSVAGIIGSPIISVSNATNTTYTQATANNVTVASDGSYYIAIRATSAANMYALFIDDVTIELSNNIKENENNFNIYPNPANDLLTINSNTTMNQITIINSLGQVVMNVEPNTDFYQININTLPEGIYTARITTNNGLSTKLIVVAH
ncbi:MAG: T9SS type A sorting domain-containing protein, partial [Bacteroidales bacterium]|nr:T9SS type A sorting domain-containing protein [Bacteroidales bacterium]